MSKLRELGDYIIQKTIGEGTFGKVKLGIHKLTKESVAIKILEKSKIKSEEELKRITEEINNLKEINNINIVQLYEILEDKNNYYLILEYSSGGELFSYIINEEKLNEQQSSFFLYQIINAVNEIHKKKICHRDIKPENILLDEKKQILKLIDFGLSKKYTGYLSTPCGSPSYVAPEMIKGLIYDSLLIDIWSCGIVLYGMIFGYLPFNDQNNEILFSKILNNNIEFPNDVIISNECRDLINKMLEKEPNKRICINDILNHPFLKYGKEKFNAIINKYEKCDDIFIIGYMVNFLGFDNKNNNIIDNIKNNKHNNITTTFKLIKKQILNGKFEYNTKKTIMKNKISSNVIGINYDKKNLPNLTTSLTSSGNSIMNELNDVINDSNEVQNNILINNVKLQFNSIDGNKNKTNKTDINQFNDLIKKNIDKNLIENKERRKNNSLEKDKSNTISNKITNYNSKGNNTKVNSSQKKMMYKKIKTENKNVNQNNYKNNSIVFKYKSNINLNPKFKEKVHIKTISHTQRQKSNDNKNNINISKRLSTSRQLKYTNIDNNYSKDKFGEKIALTETDIDNNNNNNKKTLSNFINFKALNTISTRTKNTKLDLANKKRINIYVIKNVLSKYQKNISKNKSPNSNLKNKFILTTQSISQDKNNKNSITLKNKESNNQSKNRSKKIGNIKINIEKSKSKTPNKYSPDKNINSKFHTDYTICSTEHSLIELFIGLKNFCKLRNFILRDKDKKQYTIYLLHNKKININIINKNGINMVKLTREKEEYVENIAKKIIVDVIL